MEENFDLNFIKSKKLPRIEKVDVDNALEGAKTITSKQYRKHAISTTRIDDDPLQDFRDEEVTQRDWHELYPVDEIEDHESTYRNPEEMLSAQLPLRDYEHSSKSTYSKLKDSLDKKRIQKLKKQASKDYLPLSETARYIADAEEIEIKQKGSQKKGWFNRWFDF